VSANTNPFRIVRPFLEEVLRTYTTENFLPFISENDVIVWGTKSERCDLILNMGDNVLGFRFFEKEDGMCFTAIACFSFFSEREWHKSQYPITADKLPLTDEHIKETIQKFLKAYEDNKRGMYEVYSPYM
jgi:hypothetical protein